MASERSKEVYRALVEKGFPDGLCKEIAYKYRMTDPSEEMVVDEMLAILDDRDRFRKKHEMEEAQAAVNKIYNEGLD